MKPDNALQERMHTLWDGLADFDAAQVDLAIAYLMHGLCALVDAQNAEWLGVVRLSSTLPNDPAGGWRPSAVHFLHPTEKLIAAVRVQTRRLDQQLINKVVSKIITQTGNFRTCRLCDVVPHEWFESDCYRCLYLDCGREDAIYVAFPVNEDAESWFGVFRAPGRPRFTEQERDAIGYALRGIKWFHRQLLLSHGLLVAGTPLTQTERRVLQGLLTGLSEKDIAADMKKSYHTTHEYVIKIFRKFGVNNRPALIALWLGNTASQDPQLIATPPRLGGSHTDMLLA